MLLIFHKRKMKQLVEFYYLIHYVVYNYYHKKGEDQLISMTYACAMQGCFIVVILQSTYAIVCMTFHLDWSFIINKYFPYYFTGIFYICEYLIFCGKYKELFNRYDRFYCTQEHKKKLRYAKLHNLGVFILDIALLCLLIYLKKLWNI